MPHLAANSTRVLAWLVAMLACAAHAQEEKEATTAPADQFKFIAGDADERLHLSRHQLFGPSAVGRRLYRRAAGLALLLYEFQRREIFHHSRRRGDGHRRRAADD